MDDNNLTLYDLAAHFQDLEKNLRRSCSNYIDSWIYDSSDVSEGYCLCGCKNPPIANILLRVQKSTQTKTYGLKVFPTANCPISIMNCENQGSLIPYEIYKIVQNWLKTIPRAIDRTQARTDAIKHELIQKHYKDEMEQNLLL